MMNPKKNRNPNSGCFSTIFKQLTCSSNLPTNPDHDDHQIHKLDPLKTLINTNNDTQLVELKPGLVARLMGLDSISIPEKTTQIDDALFFRSKSLNSLQFFPDFHSNKASIFHRRSASTSSFSFNIDNGVDSSKVQSHDNGKQGKKKQGRREKIVEANLKVNDDTLFFRSKSVNSLQVFPDFKSNKASIFHRRSASTTSFSFNIDDGVESVDSSKVESYNNRGGLKQGKKKQGRREKVVEPDLKGNVGSNRREKVGVTSKKRFEEGYAIKSGGKGLIRNQKCGLQQQQKYVPVLKGVGRSKYSGIIITENEKCGLLLKNKGRLGLERRGVSDNNNVGLIGSRKKRVYDNQKKEKNNLDNNYYVDYHEVSPSDSTSRSPVSVLDHHHLLLDHSPSKDEKSKVGPSSRRKPRPKNKIKTHSFSQPQDISPEFLSRKNEQGSTGVEGRKLDNYSYKIKQENDQEKEAEKAEYFVGLLGQICKLAEEQIIKDQKWVAKCEGYFVEEFSSDFGGRILESLVNELMEELLTSNH